MEKENQPLPVKFNALYDVDLSWRFPRENQDKYVRMKRERETQIPGAYLVLNVDCFRVSVSAFINFVTR